jgi:hypothetical protein
MHECPTPQTVTVASGEMTSGAIRLRPFETALYHLPTGFEGTGNDVAFYGCTNDSGTFASIVDANGNAITATPVANTWQAFQSDLFGLPFIKIYNASAQSAARTITISGSSPRG